MVKRFALCLWLVTAWVQILFGFGLVKHCLHIYFVGGTLVAQGSAIVVGGLLDLHTTGTALFWNSCWYYPAECLSFLLAYGCCGDAVGSFKGPKSWSNTSRSYAPQLVIYFCSLFLLFGWNFLLFNVPCMKIEVQILFPDIVSIEDTVLTSFIFVLKRKFCKMFLLEETSGLIGSLLLWCKALYQSSYAHQLLSFWLSNTSAFYNFLCSVLTL